MNSGVYVLKSIGSCSAALTCLAIGSLIALPTHGQTRSTPPDAPVVSGVQAHGPAAAESGAETDTARRGKAYAHMMRAVFASRRGEFRAAGAEIRAAIDLQPDSVEVHVQGAEMMRWMGRQEEAERLAAQALKLEPESAKAISFLADLASTQALSATRDEKSRTEALALFERLKNIRPLDESELRKFANLRMLDGDLEGSIEAARLLLAERPGDGQAAKLLVRLLMHQGNSGEAQRVLLRYLAKHPNDIEFLDDARGLTNDLSAWHVVLTELHENDDLDGRATATHALIGEALLRSSKMDDAVEALEAAMLFNSSDPAVRYNLTLAYRGAGRLADGAALARDLSTEYPGHGSVQRLLAETLESQRDVEGALNAYAATLRIMNAEAQDEERTTRDGIRLRIAQIELNRDRPAAAVAVVAELEDNGTAEALNVVGDIALAKRDWAGARQVARRLRALDLNGDAAMLEAESWLGAGKASKALPKFDEAISEAGPFVRVPVSRILREGGRPEVGEKIMREWREANPENADIAFQLGVYLYDLQRLDEAEVWMRRAIDLEPNHSPALNYLGYSLAERGEALEESLDLIRRALALDPSNGAYLDSLGWALYQKGDLLEAREPLERAAREFPTDSTILDHLGDVYAGLGENELALVAWARAADVATESAKTIRDKIESLRAKIPDPASPDATALGNADASPEQPARNQQ